MQHGTFLGTAVCKVGSQPGAHAMHWHGLLGTRSGARARCCVSAHGLVDKAARKYTAPPHTDLYHNISRYKIDGRHLLESVATSWAECAGSHQARIYVFRAAESVRPLRALSAVVVRPSIASRHCCGGADLRPGSSFRGVLKEGAG